MLLHGLLEKDIVEYGVLKLTKKGIAFSKKPTSFTIALNNLFEEANADEDEAVTSIAESGATDEKLLANLKDLRKRVAKEKIAEASKIYRENNKDKIKEQKQKYKETQQTQNTTS
jgi:ATP-dependent DNA helicase RecQ